MKILLIQFGWSVLLVLVIVACGSPSSSRTDAVTVLETYYDALTGGDLDKALSLVANNAVFIDPMGKYVGLDEIRAVYEPQMNMGRKWEPTNIKDTNGKGRLVYDFKAYINDMTVYSGEGLTVIKDGKIIFDGSEFTWKGECDRDPAQSFCAD